MRLAQVLDLLIIELKMTHREVVYGVNYHE